MSKFERISLGVAVALGVASLLLSWLSRQESQAANRLALATGRPFLQVLAARVRFPPQVGQRVVADLKLQNIGQREAVNISVWLAVTGQPSSMRVPVGRPLSEEFDGTVPPSGSFWVMVDTYNRWVSGDNVKQLGIAGQVKYADSQSGSVYQQQICFVSSGPGPKPEELASQLLECGVTPTAESMKPFLDK